MAAPASPAKTTSSNDVVFSPVPSTLAMIGHINNVITGHHSPEYEKTKYAVREVGRFGVGLASVGDFKAQGELCAFNGVAYTRPTDKADKERYWKMDHGDKIWSIGCAFIGNDSRPSMHASGGVLNDLKSAPINKELQDIYETVFAKVKQPFMFSGIFRMVSTDGHAIAHPPLEGDNIFDKRDKYFCCGSVHLKETWMGLTGFVGHVDGSNNLGRIIYFNPMEKYKAHLSSHAHAVILKEPVLDIDAVCPELVSGVYHIDSTGTTVHSFKMDIYPITGYKNIID